jgi:hypothetical protein
LLRRIACRRASNRGVIDMAAKPKSAKKARKAKKAKAKSHPCQALRDRRDMVNQQILDLVEAISDPDIPASIKKRLRAALTQARALKTALIAELRKCEAKNP